MRLRALVMMIVVLAVAVASSPSRTQTAYAESSRSAHEVDVDGCSREISGGVRRVLHSIVFHELTSPPYALPVSAMGPSCPLHPARSQYEPHDPLKNRQRPENRACASCGKAFVSEHFLAKMFTVALACFWYCKPSRVPPFSCRVLFFLESCQK